MRRIYEGAWCCGLRFRRWRFEGQPFPPGQERCSKCDRPLDWICGPGRRRPETRDTRDKECAVTGKEKSARIDLGLALLSARSRPNACWTYREIAAWCGCTDAGIQRIETQALRKVRKLLTLSGDELAVEALEHLRRRQGSAGYPEAKWPEQTTYE